MSLTAATMITIGCLLIAGLVVDWAVKHVRVPRVTLLLLIGIGAGPVGLDALPPQRDAWFSILATVALTMVGLLVGGDFTPERLRSLGRRIGVISVVQVTVVAATVGVGLIAIGVDAAVALPLAGIAAAAAPATLMTLVEEVDVGERGTVLLGTAVAADGISIVVFSLLLAAATVISGGAGLTATLGGAAWEIGGAVVLGVVLGVPAALLSGRLHEGRPLLEEALGVVLLSAGVSLWLEVSYLLTAVTAGIVIANVARHHERTFRQIEGIEWPFLVLFFVLAGSSLELDALTGMGVAGIGYVAWRTVGKVAGGALGGRLAGAEPATSRWIGVALLPQAGVALGMALLVEEQLPAVGSDVVAIVIVTTVVFEIAGPLLAQQGLRRMGDR